jgi:hypothetical protein
MTYEEFMSWRAYIGRRGSLNVGSRVERGFALISTIVNRAAGGKAKMEDFMPNADKPKEEASLLSVFSMLRTKAKEKAK